MKTPKSPLLALLAVLGHPGCAFEHGRTTSASPEAFWSAWTDVPSWPAWDTELEWSRLDGSFAEGTEGKLKSRGGPESRFRLIEVDPGQGYTYDVRLPLASLRVERTSENLGSEGLAFEHRVRFRGALGWFFAALLKPKYERALPGVMDRLAEAAESSPSEGR